MEDIENKENEEVRNEDEVAEASEATVSDEVGKLKAELAEAKDRTTRLYADFENFRRRTQRESLETYTHAREDLYIDLLPIVDNFVRAMAQAGDDPFSVGVKMVFDQLVAFLKKDGVEPIEAMDAQFDPALHEAVAYQPSPDKTEGTIIYETRRGYRKGDKVLRPSSVIVSSGAPEVSAEDSAHKAE